MWNAKSGKLVGMDKSHGRVTVEASWKLQTTAGTTYGLSNRGPYRYWHKADQSQIETEVPNIKTISIERGLDQNAATCTIELYNQWHDKNGVTPSSSALGNPGYLGYGYGDAANSSTDFGQTPNAWQDILIPNALLRTYQGYGGYVMSGNKQVPDTIVNAIASGNIVITGVWLIDSVTMGTNGMISLACRDMAKLLMDQIIFSPLVPQRYHSLKYSRYIYENVPGTPAQDAVPAVEPVVLGPKLLTNFDSDLKRKFGPDFNMMGTYDRNVWDGSEDTYSLSAGAVFYDRPYAKNWWEATVGGADGADINEVYISPYGIPHWTSGFQFWISIMENGVWQKQLIPNASLIPATSQPILRQGSTGQSVTDLQNELNARNTAGLTVDGVFGPLTETAVRNYQTVLGVTVDGIWGPISQAASDATESSSGIIPWDDANGDGKSDLLVSFFGAAAVDVENTDIPYVLTGSVPNLTPGIGTWFKLERTYRAQHLRVTLVPSWETNYGIWKWRVGLRKIAAKLVNVEPVQGHPAVAAIPAAAAQSIQLDGNIKDWVDPVRELLLWSGFLDYETNPIMANSWSVIETSGTYPLDVLGEDLFDKKTVMEAITSIKEVLGYIFYIDEYGRAHFTMPNWWSAGNTDENGYRVNYVPEIHDQKVITDYTSVYTDDTARSEVIMGSLLPDDLSNTTQYVSIDPARLMNGPDLIRGMIRPAIWTNEVWTSKDEQKLMATLIALHLMFQSKKGSVTCLANPEIRSMIRLGSLREFHLNHIFIMYVLLEQQWIWIPVST